MSICDGWVYLSILKHFAPGIDGLDELLTVVNNFK
jgi:hypothetical protein